MTKQMRAVFTIAILGTMFQIGHFAEHAWQWGVWLFGERNKPWMSAVADWLSMRFGELVHPMPEICGDEKAWMAKQMFYGMEVLHLVGNTIFLVTIAAILFLITQKINERKAWVTDEPLAKCQKLMKWALAIETFHLYEHIMLTATAFFLDKPVGFSTLFGATGLMAKPNAVGTRVTWHFVMNMIPTILMMMGLMPVIKDWLAKRKTA